MADNLGATGKIELDTSRSESGVKRLAQDVRTLDGELKSSSKSMDAFKTAAEKAGLVSVKNAALLAAEIKSVRELARARAEATKAPGSKADGAQRAADAALVQEYITLQDRKVAKSREVAHAQEQIAQQSAAAQVRYAVQAIAQEEAARKAQMAALRRDIEQRSAAQARLNAMTTTTSRGFSFVNGVEAASGQYRNLSAGIALATQRTNELTNSTNNFAGLRYALYDVSSTWRSISMATLGAAVAVESVGIKFESAFSGVERTTDATGEKLQQLRQDLIDMSTAMPATFGEITQAATLGGQIGIASDAITEFSDNVVKFSTTTNASVEATATGFARIAQLTGAGQQAFDKIGSAIYEVGITSVATETQILNVSQEIATAADLAGFSTQQIIGLAGALASLGVQPYLARGSITRIFREIETAVGEGGDKLDAFAQIAGVSATAFASAWKNNASDAFSTLLSGMDSAIKSGGSMTEMLSKLGITGSNDTKVLSLLANNTDIYAKAQETANQSFQDGTALSEGYAIVADDAASMLKELANTILAIAAAASELRIVKFGVEALQGLANAIKAIVENPVGGVFTAIVIGAAALIGAMAAAKAATALMQASLLALLQTKAQLAARDLQNVSTTRALIRELGLFTAVTNRAKMASDAFTASLAASGAVQGRNVATVRAVGTYSLVAATGMNTAATAAKALMSSTLIGGALVAGMWAISEAVEAINMATASAGEKAEKFFGDLSSLSEGIKADQLEDAGDALRQINVSVESNDQSLADWAQTLSEATGAQVALTDATKATTTATEDYTISLGQNTAQALLNMIANNEKLQQSYLKFREPLQQAGFDFKEFANAVVAEEGGGVAYLQQLLDQVSKNEAAIQASAESTGAYTQAQIEAGTALQQQREALSAFIDMSKNSDSALADMIDRQTWLADVLGVTSDQSGATAEDISGLGDEALNTADKLQALVDTAFGTTDGFMAQQNSLEALGKSMAQNGTSFNVLSTGGRANMEVLRNAINQALSSANGDMQAFANNLGVITSALQGFGVNVANIPGLSALTNSLPTADMLALALNSEYAGQALRQGYSSGAQQATSSTRELRKEVYTLSDYARDLGSVLQNVYDIRFGGEEAADSVADAIQRLRDLKREAQENVKDAAQDVIESRRNIADFRREIELLGTKMNGLKAARKVLLYYLKVAKEYGDETRIAALQEQLAENRADQQETQQDRIDAIRDLRDEQTKLKKLQEELRKAQEALKRSTDGNTESSRDQRNAVRDLINNYYDQIEALANSGLSQEEMAKRVAELKEQFRKQMQEVGYSREEINKYAKAFDDAVEIVKKMPRNITVDASLTPAQRAINEFLSRNTGGRGISKPIKGTVQMSVNDDAIQKFARGQKLLADIMYMTNQLAKYGSTMNPSQAEAIRRAIEAATSKLNSGNYASGGFTGRGGKYEPAGVVHRGEYVVPKEMVNQSTGLPYADAFGRIAQGYSGGGYVRPAPSVKVPSVMMVELSPTDRALLAANGNVTLTLDGQTITNAVNRRNTVQARRGSR